MTTPADKSTPRPWTFSQFSEANRKRCESPQGFNHALNSWSASDWMTATLGELGEAANVVKKINRYRDGIPGNKETLESLRAKLGRELADAFIYLDLTCQAQGIDLASTVVEVFNAKSAEIGYPEPLAVNAFPALEKAREALEKIERQYQAIMRDPPEWLGMAPEQLKIARAAWYGASLIAREALSLLSPSQDKPKVSA